MILAFMLDHYMHVINLYMYVYKCNVSYL